MWSASTGGSTGDTGLAQFAATGLGQTGEDKAGLAMPRRSSQRGPAGFCGEWWRTQGHFVFTATWGADLLNSPLADKEISTEKKNKYFYHFQVDQAMRHIATPPLFIFMCVCVFARMHGRGPHAGQRWLLDPRSWNYEWLWAIWVLGTKPSLLQEQVLLITEPSLQTEYTSHV